MPVSLKEILEGMEFQSDEMTAYLHRPTGRVILVSDEALLAAEEGAGAEAGLEELESADARGILKSGDDYLPLPDRFEIDEYRMMERSPWASLIRQCKRSWETPCEVGARFGASRIPCCGSDSRRSGTAIEIAVTRTWRGPGARRTASC